MQKISYNTSDNSKIIPISEEKVLINSEGVLTIQGDIVPSFKEDTVNNYFCPQDYDSFNGDDTYSINSIPFTGLSEYHPLQSVTINEGFTSISSEAFSNCKNLTTISIPQSISFFGEGAFRCCENLSSSINIPRQEILDYTFYDCQSITNVDISKVTNKIGDYAFSFCKNYNNIIIPEGVASIGKRAFFYCGINCQSATVSIPSTITSLGEEAFKGIPITEFTFPEDIQLQELSFFCFGFTKITSLVLPEGLQTINKSAFECCYYLQQLTIPVSVTKIETYAFANCRSFTSIIYKGTKEQWQSIEKGSSWRSGGWKTSPQLIVTCLGDNQTVSYSATSFDEVGRSTKVIKIDQTGYTTVCLHFPLFIIPSGIKLYKVTKSDDSYSITRVTSTSANVPYLVQGNPGYYLFSGKLLESNNNDSLTPKSGVLRGTFVDKQLPENCAYLTEKDGVVGFFKGDNNIIINANQAYLEL